MLAALNDIFTTRETATAIWAAAFAIWMLTQRSMRQSLGRVFFTALHWKLTSLFGATFCYVAVVVAVLGWTGLWNVGMLKDTIVWLLFSGIALACAGVNVAKAGSIRWRSVLRDQLKVVVLVEFVVATYTLPLWAELLVVPVLVTVGLIDAVAGTDRKLRPAKRLTSPVLAAFGLFILGAAVMEALQRRNELDPTQTVLDLALVPVLSLSLVPLAYTFALLSAYEQLFLRLRIFSKGSPEFMRRAKLRLFTHLKFRLKAVRLFTKRNLVAIMHVSSAEQLEAVIKADEARRGEVSRRVACLRRRRADKAARAPRCEAIALN